MLSYVATKLNVSFVCLFFFCCSPHTFRYDNGRLECFLKYKDGVPHGSQKWYDRRGLLFKKHKYKNGKFKGDEIIDKKIFSPCNFAHAANGQITNGALVHSLSSPNIGTSGSTLSTSPINSISMTVLPNSPLLRTTIVSITKSNSELRTRRIEQSRIGHKKKSSFLKDYFPLSLK